MVDKIKVGIFGRVVQGDPYKANDTDYETKQKRVFPAGHPKAGQPKITYYIALAVPKIAGHTHWAQTEWGTVIWQFGHAVWPTLINPQTGQMARDDFSWKIEDGDSTKPNKNNRINANTEGFKGNWIVKLSSPIPPKMIDTNFMPLMEPGAVKCGFWVEVIAQIDTNETQRNPGIYVGAEFIMLRGIDKEIHSGGTDPRTVAGFGRAALPSGVQAVGAPAIAQPSAAFPTPGAALGGYPGVPGAALPPAPAPGGFAPPPAPPALPGAPAPTTAGVAYPSSPPPPPGPAATPTYVTPAPSFLNQGAAPPPPPPAAPAPPAAAGPVMLPKAGNIPYATFVANKWTDAQLRAEGYIQ